MKSKKTIAKMILVAFVLSLVLPAGAFAQSSASDLEGHWAKDTITAWMDNGFIGGYPDGTFQPDKAITRAEFVKLINTAIHAQKTGAVNFSDVTSADWFYGELELAMGAGYASGFEDGTFRPAETVSRAQAAAFIAKAKNLAASGMAAERFTDSGALAEWAKGAIGAAAGAGYMSGYEDGSFQPDRALTRAEAVAMLERVMKASADVTITAANTTLANQTIDGNVLIAASVGNGNVTLEQVTIKGDLLVKGGGAQSVHVKDCVIAGDVIIDKAGVRVSFEGSTTSGGVEVHTAATLDAQGFKGSVGQVTLSGEVTANQTVTVKVPVQNMTIDTKGTVSIQSSVAKVTVNQPAKITGSGKIDTLIANVSGIQTQIKATHVEKAKGVTEPAIISASSGGSSSSGSSGGGSGSGGGDTPGPTPVAQNTYDAQTQALTINASSTEAIKGGETMLGGVIVPETISTLTIGSQVADGNVYLENINVAGQTTVQGGGSQSIHVKNCIFEGAVALQKDGVHLDLGEGAKVLGEITVEKAAAITASSTDAVAAPITAKANVEIRSGVVPAIVVASPAEIQLADGAKVNTVETQAAATITASGSSKSGAVGTIIVNSSAAVTVDAQTTAVAVQEKASVTLKQDVQAVAITAADATVQVEDKVTVANVTSTTAATVSGSGTVTAASAADGAKLTMQTNAAPEVSAAYQVSGTITNGADATITFSQNGQVAAAVKADTNGAYTVALPNGTYTGTVVREGYNEGSLSSIIVSGQNVQVNGSLTPQNVAVEKVSLNKTTLTLTVGASEKLTAAVIPSHATNSTLIWTSGDTAVATVAADGTVTAVAPGQATITATADGKSAACTVTVASTVERYAISGTVTGENGAAVAGIVVELLDAKGQSLSPAKIATTDDQGQYSFSDIAAGSYQLKTTATEAYHAYQSTEAFAVTGDLTQSIQLVSAVITHVTEGTQLQEALDSYQTVILDNDINLAEPIILKTKTVTLDLNGHTITNTRKYDKDKNGYMFTINGGTLTIDGTKAGSTITTGYQPGTQDTPQIRLLINVEGTVAVNGGSYTGFYAFESNREESTTAATTTISGAVITAGYAALANFTHGTMNVTDSTITADYYVLANNGLHGDTHFKATNCTMTSNKDTAIYFPAGDTLVIDGGSITAAKGSGIEAFAGEVTIKGNAVITAGADVNKTETVSAAGEGSRMDGSAVLIGYRAGYKTAGELKLTVESGVTLTSANNGTIRLVQLGKLGNGISQITVTCPEAMANGEKFMDNIPADTTLTVTVNGAQKYPPVNEPKAAPFTEEPKEADGQEANAPEDNVLIDAGEEQSQPETPLPSLSEGTTIE